MKMKSTIELSRHQFIYQSIEHIQSCLHWSWVNSVCTSSIDDKAYRQNWGFELQEQYSIEERLSYISLWINRITACHGDNKEKLSSIPARVERLVSEPSLVHALKLYIDCVDDILSEFACSENHIAISPVEVVAQEHTVVFKIKSSCNTEVYTDNIKALINEICSQKRFPTIIEHCCIYAAEKAVVQGNGLINETVYPWHSSGFRSHQTLMSITDPGPGHLQGTCLSNDYLDGVIVHIEHLERGINIPRGDIEPYRIPQPDIVPKVVLRTAFRAPVSTYVGRPMFDGDVEQSMLKTVHTFAAACNQFFANGVTECKISIEGMTASQAIRFLKKLSGNVSRDVNTQILSAAFCINLPIINDLDNNSDELVTSRLEIGLLGARIAALSGIEKVTWDGTADSYPSLCIIDQLGYSEALTLVHRAHEKGLLTYFSAGFRFNHIEKAVQTGVDGIGIGGAQILRFMDYNNGNQGPFKTDNIQKILSLRTQAEKSKIGLAAKLLARLDQMYFEQSLSETYAPYREVLFEAIKDNDLEEISKIRERLKYIESMPDESYELPQLASIKRVLNHMSGAEVQTYRKDLLNQAVNVNRLELIDNLFQTKIKLVS